MSVFQPNNDVLFNESVTAYIKKKKPCIKTLYTAKLSNRISLVFEEEFRRFVGIPSGYSPTKFKCPGKCVTVVGLR